ncbi:MAG: hypothetical protein ACOC36_05710, partial [Fibrobacterota bacterium]
MISSEKMLLIEKYFSGHLDRTELCTFENLVSVDREFRNEVNRRSSFEADLFGLGTAGEVQDEQVVEDCLARSQVLAPTEEEERAALKSISEQEWDEIIDGAVNAVYSSSGSRITFFRKYAGFLMAACFAGMVMAGYAGRDFLTGWLTHRKDSAKSGWYVDSPGHKQKTLPEDSLVQYDGGA